MIQPVIRLVGHWLDCRNATRLISQLADRPVTPFERLRLRWHLAACDACTRFDVQMTVLREAMRRYRNGP
ncbi:MAG TPA: zf-HC2 domain-containing protein [Casimicrobiaceae bacterium]|nr:zf-HC2 domain-containing protein [Casimicrobiaceae bacterium]